eukprot:jgi/Tetstr1/428112/TSEL_018167.t1
MRQPIQEQLPRFFATQETPMPPLAAAGEEDKFRAGSSLALVSATPGVFPISLDRVLEYIMFNLRLQPAADEYYHAACYGAFIAGLAMESRKLLAAACVTDEITPAFGQWLDAVVLGMEAVDDGHRSRLTYLRKHWDTHMHNSDTSRACL